MSYAARTTSSSRRLVSQSSSQGAVVLDSLDWVSRTGEDVCVTDVDSGDEVWFFEADTKVEETDPVFPVIAHGNAAALAFAEGVFL